MDLRDFDLSRFSYDRETGSISSNGRVVGVKMRVGYLYVSLNHNQRTPAHRLAYFLVTGQQPPAIDHVNGNRLDNRWMNLRAATIRENSYNTGRRADNTSGYKGVSWSAQKMKWRACIQLPSGKQKHIGFFASLDAAYVAWAAAAKTIQGEFFHAG